MNSIFAFVYLGVIVSGDVFKDYCTPNLCPYHGGDGAHTGCRNKTPHNGELQASCPEGAYMIDMDDRHKKVILDKHNDQRNFVAGGGLKPFGVRAACRMGAVTWDEELRLTAELHVKECKFAHDKCRNTINYPFAGQNLGMTNFTKTKQFNLTYYILNFITLWYLEYVDVKPKVIDMYEHIPHPMVSHFLAIVNERNNRIGCSSIHYEADDKRFSLLFTCNYATTSIINSTIFNTCKRPGSGCTTGRDPKYRNLCSVRENYDVQGMLDFVPYDESGGDDFDDDEDEYDETSNSALRSRYKNSPPVKIFSITMSLLIYNFL